MSLPLAALFYGLFALALGPGGAHLVGAGRGIPRGLPCLLGDRGALPDLDDAAAGLERA